MKNYFYDKYIKYGFEENLTYAKQEYKVLQSLIGSSEALELLCVFSGANGGVTDSKYRIVIELTNDRGSKPMFASLVQSMYTPYTVQRVCRIFSRHSDATRAAINILFLFASLNGRLSNDDEIMMNFILGR